VRLIANPYTTTLMRILGSLGPTGRRLLFQGVFTVAAPLRRGRSRASARPWALAMDSGTSTLEKQISELRDCKPLSEAEVEALCQKVRVWSTHSSRVCGALS